MSRANAVADSAIILAVVITMVIAVFIVKVQILDPINADVQSDTEMSAQSKTIAADTAGGYSSIWDLTIPVLLAFFWMGALITSQFIDTKPVFFVFTIVGIIVLLLVAFSMEGVYEDTISSGDYTGIETTFPKIHFLMQNIVIVILVIAFSVGVALYAKPA